MRPTAYAGAIALGFVMLSNDVRADEACLIASEDARMLFSEKRLLEARARLRRCASSRCDEDVRRTCEERLVDVAARLPTIIFDAKDSLGNDLPRVKLTVDGAPYSDGPLDAEIALDPGNHVFLFEAEGELPVERRFVLVELDKGRREHIVFVRSVAPAASTDVARPEPAPTLRTIGWVTIAAGAVGLGIGSAFALTAVSKDADAGCDAANVCDDPRSRHDARVAADNATIAFVSGIVLAGAGLGLVLLPKARASVVVGPRSVVLERRW